MAYATNYYTGDGANRTYAIAFPYLDKGHVKAYIEGLPIGFQFTNAATVLLDGPPAAGQAVVVRRETPIAAPVTTFFNASTLLDLDLNSSVLQLVYAIEEALDRDAEQVARLTKEISDRQVAVAAEAATRASADAAEAKARADADAAEAAARGLADNNEAAARSAADALEAKTRADADAAEAAARAAGIAAEAKARSDADSALAAQIVATAAGSIPDGSISTSKIADRSVTNSKIAKGSITADLLDSSAVAALTIPDGGVGTVKLADGAVTAAKLAAGAVGTGQLADSNIVTSKLADGAVTAAKLAAGAITPDKIVASSLGDGQIGSLNIGKSLFYTAAPGATANSFRSVSATLFDTINVRDYGAVGDNTVHTLGSKFSTLASAQAVYPRAGALSDSLDFHAIQAAIDVAHTGGGGTVVIPAGTYKLNGNSIDLTGSKVRLVGAGIDATTLDIQHSANYAVYTSALGYYNGLENMTITSSAGRGNNPLIFWSDERRHYMHRVKLTQYVNGIIWLRVEQSTMFECIFDNPLPGGNAVQYGIDDGVQRGANCIMVNCFLRGMNSAAFDAPRGAIGVVVYDVDAVFMMNCDISGFTDHNLYIAPQNRSQNHYFTMCYFDATRDGHGVMISGNGVKAQWQFTACWFCGSGYARAAGSPAPAAGSSDGCGVYWVAQGTLQDINFTGCRFFLNSGAGMLVTHPQADINVSGCTFYSNGMVSNTIKHGLWIAPGSAQTVGMNISGCKFLGNAAYDVMAEANAQGNVISGCKMDSGGLGRSFAGRFAFQTVQAVVDNATTNVGVNGGAQMTSALTVSRLNVMSINSINFVYLTPTFPGHIVTLLFYGGVNCRDDYNGGNLRLAGDFATTAGSVLTLMCWDDQTWHEISRTNI